MIVKAMNFILEPELIHQANGNGLNNNNTFMNDQTIKLVTFIGGMGAIGLIIMLIPDNCEMNHVNSSCLTNIIFGGMFIISVLLMIAVLSTRYFYYYVNRNREPRDEHQNDNQGLENIGTDNQGHDELENIGIDDNEQIPLINNVQ